MEDSAGENHVECCIAEHDSMRIFETQAFSHILVLANHRHESLSVSEARAMEAAGVHFSAIGSQRFFFFLSQ